jgi:hypothetical protein
MSFKTAIISFALCSIISGAAAQQRLVTGAKHPSAALAVQSTPGVSQADAQALREDLQRMRSLVQQMETNLAFVDTTQSPLKHQFELEIDMWKAVISQMERRLQPAGSR